MVFTLCLPYPGLSGLAGLGPTLPDISSSCPQMQLCCELQRVSVQLYEFEGDAVQPITALEVMWWGAGSSGA